MKTANPNYYGRSRTREFVYPVTRGVALVGTVAMMLYGCKAPESPEPASTPKVVSHLVPNLGRVVGPAPDHKGLTLVDTCIEDTNGVGTPFKDLAASYTITQSADGQQLVSKLSVVTDRADGKTHVYVNGANTGPTRAPMPLTREEADIITTGFAHWQSGAPVALPKGALGKIDAADITCRVYLPSNATLTHGGPGKEHISDLPVDSFVEFLPDVSKGGSTAVIGGGNTFYVEQYASGGVALAGSPTPLTLTQSAK